MSLRLPDSASPGQLRHQQLPSVIQFKVLIMNILAPNNAFFPSTCLFLSSIPIFFSYHLLLIPSSIELAPVSPNLPSKISFLWPLLSLSSLYCKTFFKTLTLQQHQSKRDDWEHLFHFEKIFLFQVWNSLIS